MDDQSQLGPSPLVFGAIGDAYGFCFEFAPPDFIATNNDLSYHQHPDFEGITPGVYSDDTQMHLALGELLLSNEEWTQGRIAEGFVQAFKRDPRPGYAKRFQELLESVENGAELIARIKPDSERNGAAMRAPVLGLLADRDQVIEYAKIQASITHDTTSAKDSAAACALMSHFLVHRLGAKQELPSYLSTYVPGYEWSQPWQGSVPVHGISTVHAALTVIMSTDSLSSLLRQSVGLTGDVDSVATIACACASSSSDFKRDIPDALWQGIENSEYGLDFLRGIDQRLRAAFDV